MSAASALSGDDPSVAGGAVPGVGLLRLVRRFWRTGRAMAQCVNRIARQKLEGHDLSRMAPAGFDATLTDACVHLAVAWTVALRERLLALAGRPVVPLASGMPKPACGPRRRGAAGRLVEFTYEVDPEDRHDWPALAKSWRIGPGSVAVATRMMAGKSDREVVTKICDYLRRAAEQLGAEADLARIAALEEAARALCPEADEAAADVAHAADAATGGGDGGSGGPACAPAAGPPSRRLDGDPPPEPRPDG